MNPPLTELGWYWWAIWADWAAEYRPKAEPFARKVVRSLRKMEAVGCDPKMILRCVNPMPSSGYYSPCQDWKLGGGFIYGTGWYFRPYPTTAANVIVKARHLHWVSGWWDTAKGSPADLPKPLQDSRLAWKFWKCVNRRALGIRDSVLEGLL